MATYLTRSYSHCWEDFYKGVDEQGPYYECTFLFADWADSDLIPNEMKGLVAYTGSTVIRQSPFQHPLSPNLYCHSVRVIGVGSPILNANGYPSYDGGFKTKCVFRCSLPDGVIQNSDDPQNLQQLDPATVILWCTQELDFDTEFVTLKNSTYKWQSSGNYAGVPAKIQVGLTTMSLTWHRLPYIPMAKARQYRGRTNLTTFLNAAPGYVLFKGAKTSREASTDGTVTQKVNMVFIERDQPWNKSFNPSSLAWDNLVDGSGNGPFQTAELNDLIKL